MGRHIFKLILVLSLPLTHGTIVDTVEGVVDDFWDMANGPGSTTVDSSELSDFFSRYHEESSPGDSLHILEVHFTTGTENWSNDFSSHGVTTNFSRAYYRSLDVFNFGAPFIRYMTFEDMDQIIDLIHYYLYGDISNSGFLNNDEFHRGFNELIFRNLPFGLLFVDYAGEPSSVMQLLEEIIPEEFDNIFTDADSNGDDELTPDELGVFWEAGEYGPSQTGMDLFSSLDLDSDNIITRGNWTDLFHALDCRPGVYYKEKLDLREFYQLDLILHGIIPHPQGSGNCTLAVVPGFMINRGSYKPQYFDP